RPPASTLFPYTTLFRSLKVQVLRGGVHFRFELGNILLSDIDRLVGPADGGVCLPVRRDRFFDPGANVLLDRLGRDAVLGVVALRSEEHTSELQSPCNLV